MPSEWYVLIDGQRQGPCTGSQLLALASSGRLKPSDMVCRSGMDQWVAASKVNGLFSAGVKPPPTLPPIPAAQIALQADRDDEGTKEPMQRHSIAIDRPALLRAVSRSVLFPLCVGVGFLCLGVVVVVGLSCAPPSDGRNFAAGLGVLSSAMWVLVSLIYAALRLPNKRHARTVRYEVVDGALHVTSDRVSQVIPLSSITSCDAGLVGGCKRVVVRTSGSQAITFLDGVTDPESVIRLLLNKR